MPHFLRRTGIHLVGKCSGRDRASRSITKAVTWYQDAGQAYVQADLDGNAANGAELKIQLAGKLALVSSDLLLA
ncbi:hypothetical protein QA634_04955 [Methylobacterium sp. CB376]|uniref:hypothetical protein n=1 Tax=unclassified Methylobacterium TaxID=2615210 RepID=UPI0012370974|nr:MULTISPECIES: hypothetical protein [Methylobacterium]WFT81251.1 hypothetical protein QA634_04955 [Methylobacterium nodulans]